MRIVSRSLNLAELSSQSGIPARTIRFYISRGLLDGPLKAGRGAVYTDAHLSRIEQIKKLQAEGRTLSEIVRTLGAGKRAGTINPPSQCWQYQINQDVMVLVRGDVSPWRMKQILAAIDGLAAQLGREN